MTLYLIEYIKIASAIDSNVSAIFINKRMH